MSCVQMRLNLALGTGCVWTPLSHGFMDLEKVSNININLTKRMETFIIKRVKHIFDI